MCRHVKQILELSATRKKHPKLIKCITLNNAPFHLRSFLVFSCFYFYPPFRLVLQHLQHFNSIIMNKMLCKVTDRYNFEEACSSCKIVKHSVTSFSVCSSEEAGTLGTCQLYHHSEQNGYCLIRS